MKGNTVVRCSGLPVTPWERIWSNFYCTLLTDRNKCIWRSSVTSGVPSSIKIRRGGAHYRRRNGHMIFITQAAAHISFHHLWRIEGYGARALWAVSLQCTADIIVLLDYQWVLFAFYYEATIGVLFFLLKAIVPKLATTTLLAARRIFHGFCFFLGQKGQLYFSLLAPEKLYIGFPDSLKDSQAKPLPIWDISILITNISILSYFIFICFGNL